MHRRYPCRLSAATLGHEACWPSMESNFITLPRNDVSAVDTTGAGDIFHAGFIYGLLQDCRSSSSLILPARRRHELHGRGSERWDSDRCRHSALYGGWRASL